MTIQCFPVTHSRTYENYCYWFYSPAALWHIINAITGGALTECLLHKYPLHQQETNQTLLQDGCSDPQLHSLVKDFRGTPPKYKLKQGLQKPNLSHILPCSSSLRGVSMAERMKWLHIVCLNYYVLNISMTKVPLDFSPINAA